jgi:uncharacterized protein (TIGR00730 family)
MKRVCVFCGSHTGANPNYIAAAQALGRTIAHRRLGLVYGGTNVGLMGAVADAALAQGGEVIGVIPELIASKGIAHPKLTELHKIPTMHERKALMAELSDGFIALPGGYGTLEEFFEVLTWLQLGLHRKPCGLLNVEGFYDLLIQFTDHAVAQQFIRPQHHASLFVETDPGKLLDLMAAFQPPTVQKWMNRPA